MATEVFTTEMVRLLDETEVELRPLPIAKQRKFSRLWAEHMKSVRDKFEKATEEDAPDLDEADMMDSQFDVFVKLCSFGLETQLKGDKTEKQFLSHLEDILDEHTIKRILFKTGGLTIGGDDEDPNPRAPGEPE